MKALFYIVGWLKYFGPDPWLHKVRWDWEWYYTKRKQQIEARRG